MISLGTYWLSVDPVINIMDIYFKWTPHILAGLGVGWGKLPIFDI